MKKIALLTVVSFGLFTVSTFSQTGPGGVGNSAGNPVWFDASTLNLTSGSTVSSWNDVSGNSYTASQATASKRPVFTDGAVNGKPAVDFNGTNQSLIGGANAGFTNPNNLSFYVVSQVDNLTGNRIPFNLDYGSLSRDMAFMGQICQSGSIFSYGRSVSYLEKVAFSGSSGYNIYGTSYTNSSNTLSSSLNFGAPTSITSASYHTTYPHENVWIGGSPTTYYFDGKIAEIFAFNFTLNSAQIKIIQNYLGAKYGITVPSDMFAYEGTHGNSVIGIGRDSGASLHTDSRGNDHVQINTPSDLNDGEYLFTGHSGEELTDLSFNTPDALPGSARYSRTWRVDKTGNLGSVTLIFYLDASCDFSADENNYRLLIDSDNDFSGTIDQTISGTYSGVNQTLTFSNVNFADGDFFTIAGDAPADIHSVASSDWNNPATWDCSCIPTQFNNVFIEPFNSVEVDADAFCKNLSVEPNATLTSSSNATLNLYGSFDLVGTYTPTNGTLAFVSDVAQYLDAGGNNSDLYNVTINNTDPSGVTIYSSIYTLNGTLTLSQGVLTVDPSSSLVINSTSATTTGRIGPVASGASLSGSVTVRRNIPSGPADWRDVCSPVSGATFTQWDPDLAMSGDNFADGCASSGSDPCYESVRFFKDDVEQFVYDDADAIQYGRGYYVYMGDDLTSFSGTTLNSTGTINNNASTVLSFTSIGWQTVGNPYVSPILFSQLTRTSSIGNYFYVYDNSIGDYQYYDGSTGLGSIPEFDNGLLAMGQGFWIYTDTPGATLSFDQTDKTNQATYIRSSELEAADHSLYVVLKQEGTTYQTSVIFEASDFTSDGADSLYDMMYLETGHEKAPRMYVEYPQYQIRKNFIQNDQRNKSFDLVNKIKAEGYYTLSLNNIENFADYRSVLVYDKMTGEFIDLTKEQHYVFYSDVFEGSRFTLIFTNLELVPASSVESLTINESSEDQNESMNITQMGHVFDIHVSEALSQSSTVQFVNLLGETVYYEEQIQLVQGSNIFTLPAELIGVHILVVRTGDSVITRKVVL